MIKLINHNNNLILKVPSDYFDKIYDAMDYCFLKKGDPKLEVGEVDNYFVLTIEKTESTTKYMNKLRKLINEA
jgi:hypothetical protein